MAKLTLRSPGGTGGSVELDGVDISTAVRGVDIYASAGQLPEVRLDLLVTELESETDQPKVHLAAGVHDLLVRLGWTPPEGDD